MRHFHHPVKLINYGRNLTTLPDFFLLNGRYAKELYLESGIPEKRALDSEALRYRDIINNQLIEKEESKEEAILLILDYSEAFSINMMKFIELYEKEYQRDLHYIVKPHVNSPIDLKDFKIKNAVISNDKIENLLHNPCKCICSNMTSAQIDALIIQSSVIVILDGKELNLSPLKGLEATSFVSTLEELHEALTTIPEVIKEGVASDFFFHDKKLARWKKYI
jgi:surface carbohydrate biosynthesis protein (TIGR04326 family)